MRRVFFFTPRDDQLQLVYFESRHLNIRKTHHVMKLCQGWEFY